MTSEEREYMRDLKERLKAAEAKSNAPGIWTSIKNKLSKTCIDEFFWGMMLMFFMLLAVHYFPSLQFFSFCGVTG